MLSLKQLFEYMHDVDFIYCVLRNFENLPDSVEYGDHSDLDLLVYDFSHWKELFPEAKAEYPLPRVRFKIPIGDTFIFTDVRSTGDGYMPADFQQQILDIREWNPKGFWTPSPVHHTLALAYHAVHHRNSVGDYQRWLGNATVPQLLAGLKKSSVGWVPPMDKSVGSFNAYWTGCTSIVSQGEGNVTKKQNSFKGYNLIENERRILSQIHSLHFPKLISSTDDEITVEDCGEPLTVENLPKDWKEQLVAILVDLKTNKVVHRDIKPDNLLVRDNVIFLIDFGWSRLEDDPEDSPPACLGYPYRASWNWDDNYSMRQVIKEFKFKHSERTLELCGSLG